MLASVDRHGPLFGDACANAVGAFGRLGPHAAKSGSPIFELTCIGIAAAVIDGGTCGITE